MTDTRTLIERIESCNFECEAGPLRLSVDWQLLRDLLAALPQGQAGEGWCRGKKGEFHYCPNCDNTFRAAPKYPPAPDARLRGLIEKWRSGEAWDGHHGFFRSGLSEAADELEASLRAHEGTGR